MIITDVGNGMVKVDMDRETKVIKANAIKLMNTFFNKQGVEKYTEEEMTSFGFKKKGNFVANRRNIAEEFFKDERRLDQ